MYQTVSKGATCSFQFSLFQTDYPYMALTLSALAALSLFFSDYRILFCILLYSLFLLFFLCLVLSLFYLSSCFFSCLICFQSYAPFCFLIYHFHPSYLLFPVFCVGLLRNSLSLFCLIFLSPVAMFRLPLGDGRNRIRFPSRLYFPGSPVSPVSPSQVP